MTTGYCTLCRRHDVRVCATEDHPIEFTECSYWIAFSADKKRRQAVKDDVWLTVAHATSKLGTCARRQVGCVLLNRRGHVLSTGHNGPPSDQPHCTEVPCLGAHLQSGTGLSTCEAIHAEVNALMQCDDVWEIHTVYCTDSPCMDCVKALLNTSARRIVFLREYPHAESRERWLRSHPDRTWEHKPEIAQTLLR